MVEIDDLQLGAVTVLQLKKAAKKPLRDCGFDEKWLQERINEDPSLLGLGDELFVLHKEKKQAPGGEHVVPTDDAVRQMLLALFGDPNEHQPGDA